MAIKVSPKLRHVPPLIRLANQYDAIDETTIPDQATRVAAKEDLVLQMVKMIFHKQVPLSLAFVAQDRGLKSAFTRAIGERGDAPALLSAIESIAASTQPVIHDLNMKWQVVRAYRNLGIRWNNDPAIIASCQNVLDVLASGADTPLQNGIRSMKGKLGI